MPFQASSTSSAEAGVQAHRLAPTTTAPQLTPIMTPADPHHDRTPMLTPIMTPTMLTPLTSMTPGPADPPTDGKGPIMHVNLCPGIMSHSFDPYMWP